MVKRRFPEIFYGLPYSQEQYDSATKSLEGISSFPEEQISLKEQKVISTNMKQLMAAHFFLISNKTHPFKHKNRLAYSLYFGVLHLIDHYFVD